MNDHIIFKDINSLTLGIVVSELPEESIPEERVTFTDVPGRSGALTQYEGRDVYNDVIKSMSCYIVDYVAEQLDAVKDFFQGAGELRLPTRPGGYWQATVVNQSDFAKIVRGRAAREFVVTFRCKPLFHLDAGEEEQTIASGDFLANPSSVAAKPRIEIIGTGEITLLVGTQSVELKIEEDGIVIDSELEEAYWGTQTKNGAMTGAFPLLGSGSTAISWSGGTVTSVKVTPRWVKK